MESASTMTMMESDDEDSKSISPEQQRSYEQALELLGDASNLATDLKSLPTLVDLSNPLEVLREDEDSGTSSQPRAHHAWMAKLEELERLPVIGSSSSNMHHLEMDLEAPTITTLTDILLYGRQRRSSNSILPSSATPSLEALQELGQSIPRRVCQHPFVRNDLVWVCRTCQADETCVLCHACFSQSNHEGHDVAFYHAHQGGCCDCGDADAWDPAGFCPRHGSCRIVEGEGPLSDELLARVHGIVQACAEWLVSCASAKAKDGHKRTDKVLENITRDGENRIIGSPSANRPSNRPASFDEGELDEDDDDDDEDMPDAIEHHGRVFVPAAASTSNSRGTGSSDRGDTVMTPIYNEPLSRPPTRAEALGYLGRQEEGLYLVLHADEIHTITQWVGALREALGGSPYFSDVALAKVVRMLRKHGQLVLCAGVDRNLLTLPQLQCWMDGDRVASSQVGAVLLDKAAKVGDLITSIATRRDLQWEQRAVAVLEWLTVVARSCDPLCQCVAESIRTKHLVPVLKTIFYTTARIARAWQSLLLALLAVPTFKSHLAAAYCDTYQDVTAQYARGMGVYERSGYTLSVQFLNRVTYVVHLVQTRDLLGRLGRALLETLQVAKLPASNRNSSAMSSRALNPNHFCLNHRRYTPCISDLKCVLNVKGMNKLFMSKEGSFLEDWLGSLALTQWVDTQVWRTYTEGHVETESRGWVAAFNASISLGSLFDRLLMWDDEDDDGFGATQTGVALFLHCMGALEMWQEKEEYPEGTGSPSAYPSTSNSPSLEDHKKCPTSLPFSTVSYRHGAQLCLPALPVSQVAPWSFHLPLHRFVAACLREVCRRPATQGIEVLLQQLNKDRSSFFHNGFCEFPVMVMSRVAQVRADLWKRNGPKMDDQVLNYSEPPFCRSLRDADVLLLQFSALGRGAAVLVNLLLHRFGLFEFCGFGEAPTANARDYRDQVRAGRLPREAGEDDSNGDEIPLPWSYTPAREVSYSLSLLEEFLHLLIILVSELPSVPPRDKAEHTKQAKTRLRREVIHRLASGPKTHSELNEVHQVLSHWDNNYLSEEGKQLNPDDAHGACLGRTLDEIAERKSGTLGPDKWELRSSAWEAYDPAFYHISLRHHQSSAENRPKFPSSRSSYGFEPRPYAPPMALFEAHPCFARLRRDFTADASVLAILYRTLHVHCNNLKDELEGVRGPSAYDPSARSETALSRAIHLLTIGALYWESATVIAVDWMSQGGGSEGSVFFGRQTPPNANDWVNTVLLCPPKILQDSDWYDNERPMLVLLKTIAVDGGSDGFTAQDPTLRAGAAWLCEFAVKHSADAKALIGVPDSASTERRSGSSPVNVDRASIMKKKREEAKARAMAMMKARAANFAAAMQIDDVEKDETKSPPDESDGDSQKSRALSLSSLASSFGPLSPDRSEVDFTCFPSSPMKGSLSPTEVGIPDRLLKSRPQCIICNEETLHRSPEEEAASSQRKRSRRRNEDSNALALVGYAQCSTVLKGGGGTPPHPTFGESHDACARRFVGVHVALCGHAVHNECLESYLESSSQWEIRSQPRRKDEFKCPLCQRLSNSLIPLIDVGVDWICQPNQVRVDSSIMSDDSEDSPVEDNVELLHNFLATTHWWVGREERNLTWDGHCAFVSSQTTPEAGTGAASDAAPTEVVPSKRRRSIRPLRKKDLYAAWGAMMRTPRFMRRRSKSNQVVEQTPPTPEDAPGSNLFPTLEESASAGETVVWRRFMDLVSDISYKADAKRLGEQHFLQYCGEFRHYQIEKAAHNVAHRAAGSGSSDWPSCISPSFPAQFSDTRRQEFSREKLMSKLLLSIQALTYSCCSEASEARRLIKKREALIREQAGIDSSEAFASLLSTFGIAGLACDGNLVLMPTPQAAREEGKQPFDGRMGRLRYFGLATMAAAGAVSADLVQLVMELPLSAEGYQQPTSTPQPREGDPPYRAPLVFPILFGNVLTHVVAAMCAACGRARAHSDSLDLIWPNPSSNKVGSFIGVAQLERIPGSVQSDCACFIKLGLIARVLQVLLGCLNIQLDNRGERFGSLVVDAIKTSLIDKGSVPQWYGTCFAILDAGISVEGKKVVSPMSPFGVQPIPIVDDFRKGCELAADAAVSYLSDVGTILQVLIPGVVLNDSKRSGRSTENDGVTQMNDLISFLGLEDPMDTMDSPLTRMIVSNWYRNASNHVERSNVARAMDDDRALLQKRLFRNEGFRVADWPMASSKPKGTQADESQKKKSTHEPQNESIASMEVDSAGIAELIPSATSPLVSFSSKKTVPLLGGYFEPSNVQSTRPRIHSLPTSYTDLYAQLAALCPDSEQIGLCLVCGETVNAHGKGECTKHSYKCGAGACIFFLLQECQGLIFHGDKAAYVQSPYVDSHGETPQYRGRPLNLDMDRYNIFREMWAGHTVRQKVMQERSSSRQVIIADFF